MKGEDGLKYEKYSFTSIHYDDLLLLLLETEKSFHQMWCLSADQRAHKSNTQQGETSNLNKQKTTAYGPASVSITCHMSITIDYSVICLSSLLLRVKS